jgi:hypothetical protein
VEEAEAHDQLSLLLHKGKRGRQAEGGQGPVDGQQKHQGVEGCDVNIMVTARVCHHKRLSPESYLQHEVCELHHVIGDLEERRQGQELGRW